MNGGGSVSARFFILGSAAAIASAISEKGMLADIKQKTLRPAFKNASRSMGRLLIH